LVPGYQDDWVVEMGFSEDRVQPCRIAPARAGPAAATGLSAAALAGGKSRRMGTDKAFLPLVAGGPPMLFLVLDQLSLVADDVMIVANDRERYQQFGVRVVPDAHLEIGALGGIHAAVSHAANDHCLVVACDMPFLNAGILQRMASEPRDYDVLVPVIPGESRQGGEGQVYQTLHAIYSKSCLPAIEARIEEGNRQVIGFFDAVRVRQIEIAEIMIWDPSLRSFFNANTPDALASASTLVSSGEL
jgi:molybdopterin-guanine dinucleotide biosynthesis protein A